MGAPKLFPRKMVPSSRASTAALPSSTIVVSKVVPLPKGPFQVFSLICVADHCDLCKGSKRVVRKLAVAVVTMFRRKRSADEPSSWAAEVEGYVALAFVL